MNETDESAEYKLLKAVQEARRKYLLASKEFDDLNQQILSRAHGMMAPDGVRAIQNNGKNVRDAFQNYRSALDTYVAHILPGDGIKK